MPTTVKSIMITNSGRRYLVLVKNAIKVAAYERNIALKANNFPDLKIFTAIPAIPSGRISQILRNGNLKNFT